jgi:preprotein translocase subunit SecF
MNIIGRRKIWYLISLILIVPGIVGLFIWGLPLGIDFTGGTLIDVQYQAGSVTKDQIDAKLNEIGIKNADIQPSGTNEFLIRTPSLSSDMTQKVTTSLSQVGEQFKQNQLDSVGPTMSQDLKKKAIIALIVASLAIIVYIAIAFRKVPKPASSWRFGVCAVFALIHDLTFVVGSFAILGHFFGYEINSLFITALLTIMGFSVHDTIVVFDRIRENLRKSPSVSFETNVNNSIIQTLNRSLNTSFTVLLVLLSLFLLGGTTLREFMLTLLLGIAIGTYSSIFNATPLLVSWQGWTMNRMRKKTSS